MHLAFSMYTLTIVSLWWLYDCYGYINQDNLKTYQRSLGRKLFISYEITLIIRFWIFIFSTCLFLIVCFYLFVSILWAISSFPLLFIYLFFCMRDFSHTIFFKGKFNIDSGSRHLFAKLIDGLAAKFPTKEIPELKHLIKCIFFCFSCDV